MLSDRVRKSVAAFAAVGAFLGVLFLIVQLSMGSTWTDLNRFAILIHGAYWWVILFLIYLLTTAEKVSFLHAPKVVLVMDEGLILCHNSPWISIGCGVAVYITENELERLVCVGEVVNIQTNDLVQVRTESENDPEYLDRIKTNMSRLIIRPGLYR